MVRRPGSTGRYAPESGPIMLRVSFVAHVQGFGCRREDRAICAVAGVRKPPKNEPAGDVGGRCRVLGYGDLGDAEGGCDGSQCAAGVMIRLMGGKSWC